MTRPDSFIHALSLAGVLTLVLGCTTRAADQAGSASPSPSPYASPGDVVDRARDTAEKVGDKAAEGAHKAGEAVKDAAQEVKEKAKPTAKEVGEKAKEAGQEAGAFVDAKKQSVEVKAALLADKTVDASNIDVDTDPGTKTVTLKGSVPTEAQKTAAERLARRKADGYTVRNLLTVVAVPPKAR